MGLYSLHYIDPGTGSMLFAILIGALGVLRFALRGALVRLKFLLSGGGGVDVDADSIPLVIFSDDKRYWQTFEPVVRELDARSFEVTYLTQSADDPAFSAAYPNLHVELIGEGNKGFAKLNFLKADVVLSTTPGLDVYQWKRSKDVKWYVHLPHMAGELTTYRMFGTDYYDAMLLSGEFQVRDARALESLRGLPEKELVLVGIPYLDDMQRRLHEGAIESKHERIVLLAPSWGPSSLLNRFGHQVIDALIETGCHLVIRPHPQSFVSEKPLMDELMTRYPEGEQLEWNRDANNFEVLRRADVMVSDFSNVIFDFALVFDKPVICAYEGFDDAPYDAWWLDTPIWTSTAVPRLGPLLNEDTIDQVGDLVNECLARDVWKASRQEVRAECWCHMGEGAQRIADYLVEKVAAVHDAGVTDDDSEGVHDKQG